MSTDVKKDLVFSDFAVFLRALLPQAIGFVCHDRDGKVFWRDSAGAGFALSEEYSKGLAQLVSAPEAASARRPITLENATAYLMPLTGANNRLLGTLGVFVEANVKAMPWTFCADVLRPALNSIERELGLRLRLFDSVRKLAVQTAEENLLHHVESLVRDFRRDDNTLPKMLRTCREQLNIDTAALVIPERSMRLVDSPDSSSIEISMWLDELVDLLDTVGGRNFDQFMPPPAGSDVLCLPVGQGANKALGILALSGWKKSPFSDARRRRVMRYVASHISWVLDAKYDSLTGLMSWSLFESELIKACSSEDSEEHSVMYLDIDQLHVTNDAFGRDVGDEVLVEFAALMRRHAADYLSTRITSDSFAVLLKNTGIEDARVCAERICREFREIEYVRADRTCRPSVSIGVGPLSGDPVTGSAALSTAQVACQAAKDRGRGRVEVYQSADASIVQRFDDIHLVGQVRGAIDNDRLILVGQPIVSLRKENAPQYFEVLVRLLDEEGRQVAPAEFFSAAERYQLMEELDRWVVRSTLATIAACPGMSDNRNVRFAINLSGQSLGSESFLEFVQQQLAESGVAPELLCFELTETVAVANIQRAQAFMHALRKIGCRFSLDDFGTGLSSFAYLKLFAVDTLKIDGSFIRDVSTNVVSQSVVAALSEVARVMELETVAEYVEDEAALELLRDLGVTWAQGYFTGAPAPLEDQLRLIDTSESRSVPEADLAAAESRVS